MIVHMHANQCSYVVSEPCSQVPGNRNWRYRVVDVHIIVNSKPHMLPVLQEMLEGKTDGADRLTVRTVNLQD